MTYIETLGANAAAAKKSLISADTEKKNAALQKIAEALLAHSSEIIEANAADLKAARENGMSVSMQDRLMLMRTE